MSDEREDYDAWLNHQVVSQSGTVKRLAVMVEQLDKRVKTLEREKQQAEAALKSATRRRAIGVRF
jgi:phage shock protein A